MSGANVETLRRGYDALNNGDLSVVLELLDPDIEWHEPTPSPDAGAHRGGWIESFDGFRVEPEQIVERGDDLVAVVHQTGTGHASGLKVETRLAHVWTVGDGRAVRWEAIPDIEAALGGARPG